MNGACIVRPHSRPCLSSSPASPKDYRSGAPPPDRHASRSRHREEKQKHRRPLLPSLLIANPDCSNVSCPSNVERGTFVFCSEGEYQVLRDECCSQEIDDEGGGEIQMAGTALAPQPVTPNYFVQPRISAVVSKSPLASKKAASTAAVNSPLSPPYEAQLLPPLKNDTPIGRAGYSNNASHTRSVLHSEDQV